MVNYQFISLCSRAWCLPILSVLANGTHARVSPLAAELGAGRTAITSSLQHLVTQGYLCPNPGHGHPLRPAYLLTAKGKRVASWATELDTMLHSEDDCRLARKSWTLPVLRTVAPIKRYGEIRAALNPVTDRALSQTLHAMVEQEWLLRTVDVDASPPGVSYVADGLGKRLSPILQQSYQIKL